MSIACREGEGSKTKMDGAGNYDEGWRSKGASIRSIMELTKDGNRGRDRPKKRRGHRLCEK